MKKYLRMITKAARILYARVRTQGLRTTALWVYQRGVPRLTGVPLARHSTITPHLFVGPQYRRRGKRRLEEWGVTGVVNLRAESDDAALGLTLADYCYLPTVDDEAPTLDHLREGVAFIERVVQQGGKVYIHCAGGIGRAPTMAAAYLVAQGQSVDEALATIRRARPFIRLMPPQLERLREFEQSVREGAKE